MLQDEPVQSIDTENVADTCDKEVGHFSEGTAEWITEDDEKTSYCT